MGFNENAAVAYDVGHSAVKVIITAGGVTSRFFVPSVVCPAVVISDEAEARRAKAETVTLGTGPGASFFFGETAIAQGQAVLTGLNENWVSSREHAALLVGVIGKVRAITGFDGEMDLVMGLPTNLYQSQKGELEAMVKNLINGVSSVKVIPQAMAPLYCIMLDERGYPSKAHAPDESWGVIEIGYYSSDFMMTKKGRWVQHGADICPGVHLAAGKIKSFANEKHEIAMSLAEAEEVIKTGVIKAFGRKIDVRAEVADAVTQLTDSIVDTAHRLMGDYARQLDGVIVAGGGASMVFDKIKQKWGHAIMVDDPRFAVADGMHRLGLARALKQAADKAASGA